MRYEIPYEQIYRRLYALTAMDRADNIMVNRGETPFVLTPEVMPAVAESLGMTAASVLVRLPGVEICSTADPIAFETLNASPNPSAILELTLEALTMGTLAHIYRNSSPTASQGYRDSSETAVAMLQAQVQGALPTVKPYDI